VHKHNTREVRIFWLCLIFAPVFWALFFLVALFGFKFKWVMIALSLNSANLFSYTRRANSDLEAV
jgi:ABC-type dipeptide/oligopeptide/nickel transport system permease component